jgi:hypothetical protein
MVKLQYLAELEYNNSKVIALKATFVGTYGVNGAGDLLNLKPSQNGGVDGGITDPAGAYNNILEQPPTLFGIFNEDIGGSYVALHPNAVPSLTNMGLLMYEPGGTEKASAAVYTAGELAGSCILVFGIPGNQ